MLGTIPSSVVPGSPILSRPRAIPSRLCGGRVRRHGRRANWVGSAARRHGTHSRGLRLERDDPDDVGLDLSLIHISEPTRLALI
eukprot:14330601-Alexandrium_andersonii.AAC.1